MNIRESDIAIIGMSCRFPGAKDVEAFWQNLRDEVESISFFSNQELEQSDQTLLSSPNYVKANAVLSNIEEFDASLFGYSTKDAEIMDPQQRIFLECAWEALESAGYNSETYQGPIGVYAGSGMNTYLINNVHPNRDFSPDRTFLGSASDLQVRLSNGKDYLPTRVSYKLNLTGPSVNIQTACSTALVAVHMAIQSLLAGECDLALAGAVAICVPQKVGYLYQEDMIWSADGHCRAFDAQASGTVFGNGGGVVVLKLLSQAIDDGDCIHALIKGSAINNDGALKVGYTAPSVEGQAAVISEALGIAQIDPSTVTYVETHGTGTSLGDPIEITALTQAFRQSTEKNGFCAIGSVKTNIGHIVEAAGIAGLIKTVLALKHKQIPPSLHFKQPNPRIDFANSPFYVNTTLTDWETGNTPRRAGVSSFGMGGTNCHVVLEEAPEYRGNAPVFTLDRPFHILTLSAKTEKALRELAGRYVTDLPSHPDATLANICFTANTGRKHFNHRLAIVAADREHLRQQLGEVASPQGNPTQHTTLQEAKSAPKIIAFLFTGQGSQYVNMGRQLYETQPTFRETLDRCDEILRAYLEKPLLEVLYPNDQSSHPQSTIPSSKLDETAYTQPALFALEYALCQLWKSWGIKPDVVVGHSVGEYVAACVAGVFSLEDGLKLIAERGQLIQALPQEGEMVSLLASQERVRQAISPYEGEVAIAAINSPESIVISGKREAIRAVCEPLIAEGIKTKKLTVSHAFHSPLIEPILGEFERVAQLVSFSPPLLQIISNITGQVATEEIATPEYWCRHIRQPVRWAANMESLARLGADVLVEIGPKPILLGMGRHCLPDHQGLWLPSLRPPQEDWQQILTSLTELYLHGVPVDWLGFDQDYHRRREHLPTYPFQRQRYWIQQGDSLMKSNGKKLGALGQQISTSLKTTRREVIEKTLCSVIVDVLQLDPTHVDFHASFFEMGADSLIIAEARQKIKNTYGISVSIRQFFEELSNLDAMVAYIDRHLPPEWEPVGEPDFNSQVQSPAKFQLASATVALAEPETNGIQDPKGKEMEAKGALERIMAQQLQVMSQLMSEQLDVLRGNELRQERHQGKREPSEIAPPSLVSAVEPNPVSRSTPSAPSIKSEKKETGSSPFGQATEVSVKELSPQQQQHLDTLIARYTQRTKKSKQQAQRYRPVLADLRGVLGFRPEIKEMHYPIVGDRARGARFWDVDGNEYVDITMGFGVFLFGHSASFIKTVLEEQLTQGIRIGPQSNLAGEVAQLIGELTGMERVNFCNSGTEAVMVALRVARATTGRAKIIMFSGAYHGHADGTLAVAKTVNGNLQSIPMVRGVPQEMVDNVIVLPYGESGSLEIIKEHAHELAAVLVEPVQSRQPGLQPQAFLQQLRQITREADVALIFDEIITGFRVHPGGAQAWFGVEADLATYGKLLGGGMPIGVVAGKAAYLDRIDGGMWSYGDCSYPEVERTFVAGTFCKHPLTMAASLAVLQHLKQEGPELQQRLNEQTSRFVKTLNTYFEQEEVPFGVKHFGSLFRFAWSSNLSYFYQPLEMDLLFHHLIAKGVYIWEGRICFLSTAHTNEDVEYVVRAVKETVEEMRAGGFLQNSQKNSAMLGNLPLSSKMPSATATNRATEKKKGNIPSP